MKKKRRAFIREAIGVAAGLVSLPTIIPSSALGLNRTPPSDRIVMGSIGLGGMGRGNTNGFMRLPDVQVVSICDVDSNQLARANAMLNEYYGNNDCRMYGDFREMLAKEKLDAVMIATPDHWHALLAVACAEQGIDIYGEKPLARSIKEGRAIVEAVRENNRIWQTGSWQRSVPMFHHACELVINGRIGKVDYVEVGLPDAAALIGTPPPMEVPEGVDWDFWLGPAPTVPFRGVLHGHWRWIQDYSGGQLTDWAGHHVDIAHWGLGLDRTGPVRVEGKGVYPLEGIYDVPVEYDFMCEYANGVRMRVANRSKQPKGMGTCWYGETGWIHVRRGRLTASDENILNEEIGEDETRLYKSENHQRNFIDCIRSRNETITPAEVALRSISVALLGEIAMLMEEKLEWDVENERVINNELANRLLLKPYRNPWQHDMLK